MQIARVYATRDETFLPASRKLPGGCRAWQGPGLRFDRRVVELMATQGIAPTSQRRVDEGAGLAVTQGEPVRHPGACVEDAAHLLPIQLATQIQESAALGSHGTATEGKSAHLIPQRIVLGEGLGVGLRESAAEIEGVRALGKVFFRGWVEEDDLSSSSPQELQVLPVDEAEGGTARDRYPHGRRFGRLALGESWVPGFCL